MAYSPALSPTQTDLRYHDASFGRCMTLEQIRGLVTADFEAVDRVVKQRLHSKVALVDQVATYIIYAGGKRLRPLLVLLAARACGHAGDRHIDAAAIIELQPPVWFDLDSSADGVPIEEIARLAGHNRTATTELVYRHELRPVITTGAEVMDRILNVGSLW